MSTEGKLRIPPCMTEAARASIALAPERFSAPAAQADEEPERSFRLRLVTGFYLVAAALSTVTIAIVVVLALTDYDNMRAKIVDHPVSILSKPFALASTWFTWRLLQQRRRLGAIVAAIPLLQAAYTRATSIGAEWIELVFPLVGLLLIASIWKELE